MSEVERADELMEKLAVQLEGLCYLRLARWRREFTAKFPRQHGKITFGNGTELVEFGGKQYNSWDTERYRVLKPLYAALEDIWYITNQYRLACPDDFTW